MHIESILDGLAAQIAPRFADLIRIAAFVHGADSSISRGRLEDTDGGKQWHRSFRMVIEVQEPDFWNQPNVVNSLQKTLGFLSQDSFRLEFQAPRGGSKSTARQLVFGNLPGHRMLDWSDIEEVSLFSGGLDSLVGASQLTLEQKKRTMLVTHRSAAKMWSTQKYLADELGRLSAEAGTRPPHYIAIRIHARGRGQRKERTQRTRSFLYAALAGAVAHTIDLKQTRIFENGVVATNLPISRAVVGARATRTAHPRTLAGFASILSLVSEHEFSVKNPFALTTRAETIQLLGKLPAIGLAKHTMSCAHVIQGSTMHPHCGRCSQCIDRQFGFLGAGMTEHDSSEGYEIPLVEGPWTNDEHRSLVIDWISAADSMRTCKDSTSFLEDFGEAAISVPFLSVSEGLSADDAIDALFSMHKRHGECVDAVISQVSSQTFRELRSGRMSAHSLPALLVRDGLKKRRSTPTADEDSQHGASTFRFTGTCWELEFRGHSAIVGSSIEGMRHVATLLGNPGRPFTTRALEAAQEGEDTATFSALDASGARAIDARISHLQDELREASDACDTTSQRQLQDELDIFTAARDASRTAPTRPAQSKEAQSVSSSIKTAVKAIAQVHPNLGYHLERELQIGSACWYRATTMVWRVTTTTGRASYPPASIDTKTNRTLVGWVDILPALGFKRDDRRMREMLRELNSKTDGPISRLSQKRVSVGHAELLIWWDEQRSRLKASDDHDIEATEDASADIELNHLGTRIESGMHLKGPTANDPRRRK